MSKTNLAQAQAIADYMRKDCVFVKPCNPGKADEECQVCQWADFILEQQKELDFHKNRLTGQLHQEAVDRIAERQKRTEAVSSMCDTYDLLTAREKMKRGQKVDEIDQAIVELIDLVRESLEGKE